MKTTSIIVSILAALSFATLAQDAVTAATPKAAPAGKAPATVYFTHDISPEGLAKAYKALGRPLEGKKVAVKISTGEAGNDHFLKPALIGPLVLSL